MFRISLRPFLYAWLVFSLALFCGLPVVAQTPAPPQAADDTFRVLMGDELLTVTFSELLANDGDAVGGSVTVLGQPLHGVRTDFSDGFTFTPSDNFWAVGGDHLVYQVDTAAGSSHATIYFAVERTEYVEISEYGFEDATTLPVDRSPTGVSIVTGSQSLLGAGSLGIAVASATDDVYAVIPLNHETGQTNLGSGETEGCAGGFASLNYTLDDSEGARGYLLLLGDENSDIFNAKARVGVTKGRGDLFVDVRDSGTNEFVRSALITRGNDIVRFRFSYALDNGVLRALLRADGLATRSPLVTHTEADPTHIKIGFFQPEDGDGTTPDMVYDDLTLGPVTPDLTNDPGILFDPIQGGDDFEGPSLAAWVATHGSGLIQDAASALSGDRGLGVTGLTTGQSFVSFQTATAEDDPRFRKLTVRAEVDLASFSIDPGRLLRLIDVRSATHAIFGTSDFELQLRANAASGGGFDLRPAFYIGSTSWVEGAWTSLTSSSARVELQVGRSDGDGMNNGFMHLWVDGTLVARVYGIQNHDRPLRTVHVGATGFNSQYVSGTIRIDNAMVTR